MRENSLSQLRILVVDDNKHFVAIMRTMLRAFGAHHIVECSDAVLALEALKRNDISLALIDYKLGDIDGLELTGLIRRAADSQNPRMPIIMVTAYAERSNVQSAIAAGVDEFLVKPVSPIKLYRRIAWLIANPRPYLRSGVYFGPDRRRRILENYRGPGRRDVDQDEAESPSIA